MSQISDSLPSVPPAHPCFEALRLAGAELRMGEDAALAGNEGRARVCGRRAVGTFIQTIAPAIAGEYGTHAMANLRAVQADESLPDEIRAMAGRLLGGARSILAEEIYSTDPLGDAIGIIRYFVAALKAPTGTPDAR
ncbi:MAG: hypothetical protein JWQ98_3526 [Chlorobi bacterium]|nr:hypothetical protein [Chlorobiota bacterium]